MFDFILTIVCENATLRTCFPLLERELKILSFFDVKMIWLQSVPSTQTCAKVASVLEQRSLTLSVKVNLVFFAVL